MPDRLVIHHDGARTTVSMKRPEVHNAFDERLIAELHEAFTTIAGPAEVAGAETRVVVLAGVGRSFSAGADLDWMRRAAEMDEAANRRDAAALAAMLRAVDECPVPVVAAVQGGAFGGGVGLVAAADVAIATESARFAFTEVRLGLVPATVAPFVIAKIGAGHARRLFLTAQRFDARHALDIGLVHHVVPDVDLERTVDDVVGGLLAGGAEAQRLAKELVREVRRDASAEIDRYTSDLIARARASAEGREGVLAFLEKRAPGWRPE